MSLFFTFFLKFYFFCSFFFLLFLASPLFGAEQVLGFNLTEPGCPYSYEANLSEESQVIKTNAQVAVDEMIRLGVKHIVINVRAHQIGPRSSEIQLAYCKDKTIEENIQGLRNLIKYIHEKGLTLGIRPILLILGPNKEFPYYEKKHSWWHGNIRPNNPSLWFQSFENFILYYVNALKDLKIDEFTMGAEMQSMMVGMGSSKEAYLLGQPENWLLLLRKIKSLLPSTQLTYDINFPETKVPFSHFMGGEFERWRFLIVDLSDDNNKQIQFKRDCLIKIWKELDFIGLDFYRFLASSDTIIPTSYDQLVNTLSRRTQSHANQIDNALSEIEGITGLTKKVVIKEIGYRSTKNSFINPASYALRGGTLLVEHQAASYEAIHLAFWQANWPWLKGIYFWDVSVDPNVKGSEDKGFSPIGKSKTEEILKRFY